MHFNVGENDAHVVLILVVPLWQISRHIDNHTNLYCVVMYLLKCIAEIKKLWHVLHRFQWIQVEAQVQIQYSKHLTRYYFKEWCCKLKEKRATKFRRSLLLVRFYQQWSNRQTLVRCNKTAATKFHCQVSQIITVCNWVHRWPLWYDTQIFALDYQKWYQSLNGASSSSTVRQ